MKKKVCTVIGLSEDNYAKGCFEPSCFIEFITDKNCMAGGTLLSVDV